MDKIINSPYNINAVARVDSDNIVHNHIYHHCPIGRDLMTIILFMITIII